MTFKIPMEGPTCIRCGHDKKLDPLFEFVASRPIESGFYVCRNRDKCLSRQLSSRPARMTTQAAPDTRECGFMGCGRIECEPVCAGIPKERNT